MRVCACECSALEGLKRELDALQLELQAVVRGWMWMLGTPSALNH